tara:strand:- start:777 stop:1370 length:594 start_codon:yes stop_codon:yes gene_type:complete
MLLRTDDVLSPTDNLKRFLEITEDVPILLATIPKLYVKEVVDLIEKYDNATVVQHGYDHRNRAPEGEKKSEFPSSRDVDESIIDIKKGKEILEKDFGDQFYPVFVPPWNRFGLGYSFNKQVLSELGFIGIEDDEGTLDMQPKKGWITMEKFWRKVQTDDTIDSLMFHHEWMTDEQFKFLEQLIESGVISWKSIRESS